MLARRAGVDGGGLHEHPADASSLRLRGDAEEPQVGLTGLQSALRIDLGLELQSYRTEDAIALDGHQYGGPAGATGDVGGRLEVFVVALVSVQGPECGPGDAARLRVLVRQDGADFDGHVAEFEVFRPEAAPACRWGSRRAELALQGGDGGTAADRGRLIAGHSADARGQIVGVADDLPR